MKHISATRQLLLLIWLSLLLIGVARPAAYAQGGACTGFDPGNNPATAGLYAEYFAGYFNDDQSFFTLNAPGLIRIDPQVNFPNDNSFGNIVPPADNNVSDPGNFSSRYRGHIDIPVTGSYTFYLNADDGAMLWFDDAALDQPAQNGLAAIWNGGSHSPITRSVTLNMTAGPHNVLIHYGELHYGNTLVWEWESAAAGITRQVVPSSVLCTRVLNTRMVPEAITYSPSTVTMNGGNTASSGVPTVRDGGLAITAFAIANAGTLPAGITINSSTGVLSANATVPLGTYNVSVSLTNGGGTTTFGAVFRFVVLLTPPSGCGGTDAGGSPAVAGLYSEFYSGNFGNDPAEFLTHTPAITRISSQLNYLVGVDWGDITAAAVGPISDPNTFTAQFRGSLYAPTAGYYTLYLTADDGANLWLDNDALASPAVLSNATIRNGGAHSAITEQATVYLTAGLHSLLVQYIEGAADNVLTLEWSSTAAGISRQYIPQSAFCSAQQAMRFPPSELVYSPANLLVIGNSSGSSAAPTVQTNGYPPVLTYLIANAGTLPAGITINSSTGVISSDATVPTGTYLISVLVATSQGATVFTNIFDLTVTPAPPPGCAGTNAAGQAAAGFLGQYYAGYFDDRPNKQNYFNANTPAMQRVDAVIDFSSSASWGTVPATYESPTNPDDFSVRLRGSIYVVTPGEYTFYLTSDDASYMWIDAAANVTVPVTADALIQNGSGHAPIMVSNTVTLTAGLHNVLIHYGEYIGGNVLKLEWSSTDAGLSRQVIDPTSLCSIAQSIGVLPVTLTRFTAQANARQQVDLNWETAQEKNNARFELERSADGRTFETIGSVTGAGTVSTAQRYHYTDSRPLAGLSYYRLRQVDFDGTAALSSVVAVQLTRAEGPAPGLTLYPNPTAGDFTLSLVKPASAATQLQIVDLSGRVVYTTTVTEGTREQAVQPKGLAAGVYLVRLTSAEGTVNGRLIVR